MRYSIPIDESVAIILSIENDPPSTTSSSCEPNVQSTCTTAHGANATAGARTSAAETT
jgi:hypothetical protein